MPASQVGDLQAASRLFRLLIQLGHPLIEIYDMAAPRSRKETWGRKRTAVSAEPGVSRRFIEPTLRYLLYLGLLAAALFLPAGPAAAACDQFTPFGQPVSNNLLEDVGVVDAPDRVVICHTSQVVAFSPKRNVSDWVAYRLRREDLLNPTVERKDNFRPDPQAPEPHRVVHADYTHTGYDRGHLAPAAAMRWSFDAMTDSLPVSMRSKPAAASMF